MALLSLLVGSAFLSATVQSAEVILAIYDKFVRPHIIAYTMAGVVGVELLFMLCRWRILAKKGARDGAFALFAVIASAVGSSVIVYSDAILDVYRLYSEEVAILASALTICLGAAVGAYYGMRGTPHKILRHPVVLGLLISMSAVLYVYARDVIGGQPGEYPFVWHLVAVGAVASAAVLVAIFGIVYAANKRTNQRHHLWEIAYWLLLFGVPVLIAVLSVHCDISADNGTMLQFGVSAVVITTGAALGAHFNSLHPRFVAHFLFGWVVLALVFVTSWVGVEARQLPDDPYQNMELSITLALISPLMGVLGVLLGAHMSVHLKKQGDMD